MVQLQGTIPHPKGVAMVLLHNHKEDSIHPLLNSHNLHITKVIHRVDSHMLPRLHLQLEGHMEPHFSNNSQVGMEPHLHNLVVMDKHHHNPMVSSLVTSSVDNSRVPMDSNHHQDHPSLLLYKR